MARIMGCGPCHKYILYREGRRKTPYDNCIQGPVYLLVRILLGVNRDSAFAQPRDGIDSWAFDAMTANQVGSAASRIP